MFPQANFACSIENAMVTGVRRFRAEHYLSDMVALRGALKASASDLNVSLKPALNWCCAGCILQHIQKHSDQDFSRPRDDFWIPLARLYTNPQSA